MVDGMVTGQPGAGGGGDGVDGNGTVKLEAAQQSLLTAINATATPRQPVGLWSYPDDGDCGAGHLERAATSGGKDELDAIIRSLRPNGGTPTRCGHPVRCGHSEGGG